MRTLLALAFLAQSPQVLIMPTEPAPSRAPWDHALHRVAGSIVPIVSYRAGDEDEPTFKGDVGAHPDIICTAVVVGKDLLLTERHCLADEVEFTFDGVPLLRRFDHDELVLVQTNGRNRTWQEIEIRKSQVELGESVGALGYVLGSQSPLFAAGVVTGGLWDGLLTTIPIWPGHSGSPIFDTQGRLVTLVRQTRQPQGYLSPWTYSETPANLARFLDAGRAEFRRQDVASRLRK